MVVHILLFTTTIHILLTGPLENNHLLVYVLQRRIYTHVQRVIRVIPPLQRKNTVCNPGKAKT